MEHLTKQKMEELAGAKKGWQESLQKLANQNAKLKVDLEELEKNKTIEINRLRLEKLYRIS